MRRLLQYLVLVSALLLGSLHQANAQGLPKKLHFEGFAKATHISTSGMNLWVTLNNESIWRYEIKSCELDVYIEGSHLATISLRDKVVIPRKQRGDVLLPLRFESRSSFALGRLLWRIINGDSDKITLSYSMRAGVFIFTKRIEERDIQLRSLIDGRIGVMDAIECLWQMVK